MKKIMRGKKGEGEWGGEKKTQKTKQPETPEELGEKRGKKKKKIPTQCFFLLSASEDHEPVVGEMEMLHQDKSATKLPAPHKHI